MVIHTEHRELCVSLPNKAVYMFRMALQGLHALKESEEVKNLVAALVASSAEQLAKFTRYRVISGSFPTRISVFSTNSLGLGLRRVVMSLKTCRAQKPSLTRKLRSLMRKMPWVC